MPTPDRPVSRVLAIAPTPFFGDRGCHVRIYEEVRALAALDIESLVVTYPTGKDLPDVRIRRSPRLPGIEASALGFSWSRPLLDGMLLGSLLRAIHEWKPQVLHAHLHEGVMLATVARLFTGLPVVADLQGSLTEELIDHKALASHGIATSMMRGVERWLARRPDVLLVSSAAASGLVGSAHVDASRVVALPDGADLEMFKPAPRDQALAAQLGIAGKPTVVFLGVLTPYQGVDALLEAVPLVARQVPDVRFVLMGYPNEDRYRSVVRDCGLETSVLLPGRIPYADAPRWLGLGDVAVSPKQSLTEANGKLLNYMACGLPTVATDTAVNRELLGPHGRYVPVGNVPALADGLIALLRDATERARLGASLRERVEREFSWSALGRRLARVYQLVADGRAITAGAA